MVSNLPFFVRKKKTDTSVTKKPEKPSNKNEEEAFDVTKQQEGSKKVESPGEGDAVPEAWRELDLHPSLLTAIQKCRFEFPLPIQSHCIPAATKKRKDVLGAAQTGSGKTLAFGIPIFQRLLEEKDTSPATPTPTTNTSIADPFVPTQNSAERDTSGLRERTEEEDSDLEEIHSEEEGMDIDIEAADGVDRVYEDADDMCISDGEMEELHKSLGTVYYSDLSKKEQPESSLKALILTPTRELALQAYRHLKTIGRDTGIRVVPVVGGMAPQKQTRLLSYNPEVVVATPGRFLDLYRKGIPHLRDLTQLRFFVVDECDKMIRHGDFKDLTIILQTIPEYQVVDETFDAKIKKRKKKHEKPVYRIPAEHRQMQTLLFSATLTLPRSLHRKLRTSKRPKPEEEDVDEMALALDELRFRGEPVVVDLTSKARLADRIQEAYLPCPEDKIDACLYSIIMKHPGRTLVFCNAIKNVRKLTECLRLLNIPAQPIHAAKQQSQRLKALDRFTADGNSVLVATDVAARGLDIPNVRCVVHYNVPRAADLYIHRSGRTARVEADGLALSLVTPSVRLDSVLRVDVERKRKMPPLFPLDQGPLQECEQRVKLAKRIRDMDTKLRFEKKDAAWTQKAADALQSVVKSNTSSEDGDSDEEELSEECQHIGRALAKRLAEPLEKQITSKFITGTVLPDVKGPDSEAKKRSSASFKESLKKARQLHELRSKGGSTNKPSLSSGEADRIKRHQMKLNQILDKKIDKKQKMRALSYAKQKLVVIPQALGRAAQGPDALHVVRDYIQRKQRSTS